MGAGDLLAGDGLAGDDDLALATETRRARPVAISFDGTARDFPLGDDGRYVEIHPVDSAMQMACMIGLNGLASSPGTGNGLRDLEYLDPLRLNARVQDNMRLATARLVALGDVTIDRVWFETNDAGGLLAVAVDYFNERIPGGREAQRRTAEARV